MALISDITTVTYSGYAHIDALLDSGPGWNWLLPTRQELFSTSSIASGNEANNTDLIGSITAFNAAQQDACLDQLVNISQLTGITFTATSTGTAADLHFAAVNISNPQVTGLCSWRNGWTTNGSDTLASYTATAYVYLDNAEWASQNDTPNAGGFGYKTLLHEMGHALGLKHPFDGTKVLSVAEDNKSNSIMSYTSLGGPYSTFSPYDVATLAWIYGGDGLGGSYGVSTTGRYVVGTSAANVITGPSGNDKLEGLAGNDTFIADGQSDVAFENVGEGVETLISSASFYLYNNIENLTLTGAASFGVGNNLGRQKEWLHV